jgi:hypothetical protein
VGMNRLHLAPGILDDVQLVALELEVPVAHPVEVASKPLAGRETNPVLGAAATVGYRRADLADQRMYRLRIRATGSR